MLQKLTGALGPARAAHFLRRTAFGFTKEELDTFSGLTAEEAMDRLYAFRRLPEPPRDTRTNAAWIENYNPLRNSPDGTLKRFIRYFFLHQCLGGNAPQQGKVSIRYREHLVFFLHTFFTTQLSRINQLDFYRQLELFRLFASDTVPDFSFKKPTTPC